MIFLDTSFLIAFFLNTDEDHARAAELGREMTAERLVLSSHNIEEAVTFLQRRENTKKAKEVGERLLEAQEIEVMFPDKELLLEALQVVEKHGGLSLCDALAIVIMKQKNIKKIASFDSDFDRFPGIQRLY